MSDRPTVLGTPISATSKATHAGHTHVLTAPAQISGFAVPARSTIYVRRDGTLDEIVIKATVAAGGTKVKGTARIALDQGRYLLGGACGQKLVQGGFSIAAGDPVRVAPDGTVLVVFPSKACKIAGELVSEGTRLDWNGKAFTVVPDGEYVPDTGGDEDDDEDFEPDDDLDDDDGDEDS